MPPTGSAPSSLLPLSNQALGTGSYPSVLRLADLLLAHLAARVLIKQLLQLLYSTVMVISR